MGRQPISNRPRRRSGVSFLIANSYTWHPGSLPHIKTAILANFRRCHSVLKPHLLWSAPYEAFLLMRSFKRRWLQVSLRASLCLCVVAALVFSWLGHHFREHQAEQRYIAAIHASLTATALPASTPLPASTTKRPFDDDIVSYESWATWGSQPWTTKLTSSNALPIFL